MNTVLETLAVVLGVNGALSTGALVYTVRRVSPWPKPPALPQAPGSRSPRRSGAAAGGQPGTADGTVPPGGTS